MLMDCKSRGFISKIARWLFIVLHGNEALKLTNQHFLIAFSKFQDDVIMVHKSPPSHIYSAFRTLYFTNLLSIYSLFSRWQFLQFSFSILRFYICFQSSNKIHEWYIDNFFENFGKCFLSFIFREKFFLQKICKKTPRYYFLRNLKKNLKIFLENFNENYFVERIYEFFL